MRITLDDKVTLAPFCAPHLRECSGVRECVSPVPLTGEKREGEGQQEAFALTLCNLKIPVVWKKKEEAG